MPDAFTDEVKVIKSYVSAVNVPGWFIVPKKQLIKSTTEELFVARKKLGRPIGSKDSVLRKRKIIKHSFTTNDAKNLKRTNCFRRANGL